MCSARIKLTTAYIYSSSLVSKFTNFNSPSTEGNYVSLSFFFPRSDRGPRANLAAIVVYSARSVRYRQKLGHARESVP